MLAVALALLIASGFYYLNLNAQATLLEVSSGQIQRGVQRGQLNERAAAALALEVKRANEVLRQLTTPWGGLFQTLESTAGNNVALLSLEPNTENQLVRISGEAKNIAAMLDYIQRLENREVFGTVYLQSHHVQLQDAEKPVRFVLQARWLDHS